ncbi:FMN-binding negative transcriptional regulator [Streptomyces sp. RPA4-2]|uniref:FMN-binding negative transcriptional regulator n=1 Tax=Streptomyces sp. RPA4-2 TaxID=2721244 RepID=UPI00143EE706|nr:FMN-binding negative transcriptional regulator [Streptomyces sp. RPA4-2]QIY61405.1 FMN-binding negative transcriptional regulator [Streptomyces sp. RPA4-2]
MYVPRHFSPTDEDVRQLLNRHGAADLVTVTEDGLQATLLPFVHDPAAGEHGSLIGHMARNNDQWKLPTVGQAMVIVRGPDAYVTPTWYPSKAEHHRQVPTWNYITAHVHGNLLVHDDPAWVEDQVRRLTDKHEAAAAVPWSVDDAPAPYIQGQLRAIVGVELSITRIEAKFKLSQNRSDTDISGVVHGLRSRGQGQDGAVADAVHAHRPRRPGDTGEGGLPVQDGSGRKP